MSATTDHATREKTNQAVIEAAAAWAVAPLHIRVMAGAYVAPLLAALTAINEEMKGQK